MFVVVALAAASGIGGGSALVPIYVLISGFKPNEAVPISKVLDFTKIEMLIKSFLLVSGDHSWWRDLKPHHQRFPKASTCRQTAHRLPSRHAFRPDSALGHYGWSALQQGPMSFL